MDQIKEVGRIMGKADQEVIRLATEIGLEHLRRVEYNIAKPILDGVAEAGRLLLEKDRSTPKDKHPAP